MKRRTIGMSVAAVIGLVALLALGFCFYVAHEAVQATQYMRPADAEAAIKQDPSNALAHQRLGEALMGHDRPRAISEFRKVIQLQPDNRQVIFELAYELKHAGHIPEAKAIFQQLAMQHDAWGQAAERHLKQLKRL